MVAQEVFPRSLQGYLPSWALWWSWRPAVPATALLWTCPQTTPETLSDEGLLIHNGWATCGVTVITVTKSLPTLAAATEIL